MMRTLRYTVTFVAIAAFSMGALCSPEDDSGDNGGEQPDGEVIPDGSTDPDPDEGSGTCTDPCNGDLVVFGPETFTRTCAAPNTWYRDFDLAEDTDVCIIATNFGNAAAIVKIDGDKVMRQDDFNPHITQVVTTVSLTAGQHELKVWLASVPDSSVTIEMRACEAEVEPPDPPCSVVATEWCEDKGWHVESSGSGSLVCAAPGFNGGDSCLGCTQYNVVVWTDGGGDPLCAVSYGTSAGLVYGGHTPCACADNLMECGIWEMQSCIPD